MDRLRGRGVRDESNLMRAFFPEMPSTREFPISGWKDKGIAYFKSEDRARNWAIGLGNSGALAQFNQDLVWWEVVEE